MALTKVRGAGVDADGQEVILDADGDTTLTVDTDDQIDIKVGGTDRAVFLANNMHLIGGTVARIQLSSSGTGTTPNTGNNNVFIEGNDDTLVLNAAGNGQIIFQENGTESMRINASQQVQVNSNQTLLDSDTFFQVNVNGGNGDSGFMAIACNGSNVANQEAGIYLGRTNNRIMTTVDGSANFRDDIQIRAGGSGGVSLSSGGTSFSGASDEKLKTIIENITGALDNVAKLRTVIGRFEWDAEDKRRSFLIAQDVQAVLPEVVEKNPEGNLMLDYTGVIPLLTAALKEAKTKIDALETKNDSLEARLTALESK